MELEDANKILHKALLEIGASNIRLKEEIVRLKQIIAIWRK